MSDLIDRYLSAVAALLPKASRQDIVAELRDLIMNRVEEREAALGRPLDKAEMEALLREIGHPIAVAGRYGPRTALVGPELYPFWLFGVKVMLAIAAIAAVVPVAVLLVTGQGGPHMFNGLLSDFTSTGLKLVGLATLVAAAVERGWIKLGDFGQWKASELPRLSQGGRWYSKTRFDGLFELVATVLFIGWWTGVIHFPIGNVLSTKDGAMTVTLAPLVATLWWPILALAVIQLVSSLILVAKPGWVRPRATVEILGALGGLALAALLWPAQPLVTFGAVDIAPEALANLQRTVDLTFRVILVVASAINAGNLALNGWRLVRGR